eukprot:jgi/Botrbrau1/9008/Bobra.0148s0111.1
MPLVKEAGVPVGGQIPLKRGKAGCHKLEGEGDKVTWRLARARLPVGLTGMPEAKGRAKGARGPGPGGQGGLGQGASAGGPGGLCLGARRQGPGGKGATTGRWEHAGQGGILVGKGRDQGKRPTRGREGAWKRGYHSRTSRGRCQAGRDPPKSNGNNSTREVNMLWDRRQL